MVAETVVILPQTVDLVGESEALNIHGLLFQNVCLCPLRTWLHYNRVDCAHLNRHMRRGTVEQSRHYRGVAGALQGMGIAPDMLDFKQRVVSEVKSRKSFPYASRAQLLFYTAVLSVNTGEIWSGLLRYPASRRTEAISLTPKAQLELCERFLEIKRLIGATRPPTKIRKRICQDCSYRMVCWQRSSDDTDFG